MNTYKHSLQLRIAECDVAGRWRVSSIMAEMQEAAGAHSDALGIGRGALLPLNIVWVLSRLHLHMFRYPGPGDSVTLQTYHRPVRHRFFPRFFRITDGQGEVIGQASSLWLLMDLSSRQSVSPSTLPVSLPDNSSLPELLPLREQITALDVPESVIHARAVFTDLDPNGHVNNARYADWLCNALGTEVMCRYAPEDLIIQYNAEILPDESFLLHLKREDLCFQMTGLRGSQTAFEIGGILKAF